MEKVSLKTNWRRIFFFSTFESVIESALRLELVTSEDVLKLACKSDSFYPIWERLDQIFGSTLAMKKIVDKVRTFARNNRQKFSC